MNYDSAFFIGKSHSVCEDFAIHGETDEAIYAIVSDGCSSSKQTDIGARLLALAAQQIIRYNLFNEDKQSQAIFFERSIQLASDWAKKLGLKQSVLDATLSVAYANKKDNKFHIALHGDGAIYLKAKDGTETFIDIEYTGLNAPYYPNYLVQPDLKEKFFKLNQDKQVVTHIENHKIPTFAPVFRQELSINDIEYISGSIDDFVCVAVLSDGINTFGKNTNKKVSYRKSENIIFNMFNFKNGTGQFILRSIKWWINQEAKTNGMFEDDLSVGALWF